MRSALVLCAFACLALASVLVRAQQPNLYVTFHGGKGDVNSIYAYDLSGKLLVENVLRGDDDASELRGAILLPDKTLLVANAHKTDSRLVQYSACTKKGHRDYVTDWATSHLAHPYGVVSGTDMASGAPMIYASNQDTYDVVQFSRAGHFKQQVKQFGTDELRGLAFDDNAGILYVANEDQNAVLAYNTNTESWDASLNFANITTPIGLFIDYTKDVIFIGSNAKPTSAVYAYSLQTRALVQTFTNPGLQHPAGMVSFGDSLYVLSQKTGTLLVFDIPSGQYQSTPITSFPDTPEQILLSPC